MRTTQAQFEIIVDYMERHGDLFKFTPGAQGRIAVDQHWKKLCDVLNKGLMESKKSIDKWKKVWSDLKSGTKSKAVKNQKTAKQAGIELRRFYKLSDLEQRVLKIIDSQVATGSIERDKNDCELVVTAPTKDVDLSQVNVLLVGNSAPGAPSVRIETLEKETSYILIKEENGQARLSPIEVESSSHCRELIQDEKVHATPRASPSPPVISHRRSTPLRKGPRRLIRRARQTDSVSRFYAKSDERWQSLFNKFATEHLRLREVELQQQARWQTLFEKLVTTINKFAGN